jgi:3-oxoadipate enol-lactonase
VLLLHGWTATADLNWVTSYKALQRHYRVVALDHRGHGRGIRSIRPFRLEDCADDAAALCDVLGIERAIVCGYSMGGPIAQLTWRRHRDLVTGLVLCATARRFGNGEPRMKAMGAGLLGASLAAKVASPALRGELVRRYVSARIGDDPRLQWAAEQIRRNDPGAVLQAGAALMGYDATPWIGDVDVPTSVVVTTQDNVVPPHRQRALAASIPGSRTVEVNGTHAVVVENPGAFVPGLLRAVSMATSVPTR